MRWDQPQYVYIMRWFDPETRIHLYKIGISINPWYRAKVCKAQLLSVEPGGRERERYLHGVFSHLRITRWDLEGSTEWFVDEEGEITAYVNELLDAYAA